LLSAAERIAHLLARATDGFLLLETAEYRLETEFLLRFATAKGFLLLTALESFLLFLLLTGHVCLEAGFPLFLLAGFSLYQSRVAVHKSNTEAEPRGVPTFWRNLSADCFSDLRAAGRTHQEDPLFGRVNRTLLEVPVEVLEPLRDSISVKGANQRA